ncbi:serine-rich adhesin for platelets-like isoform X2 [Mercenaria mercenaria]|uniref:serine-rich adhesin for platelets-like isoform X2 n=1 Tax=Mercenaria mercenaria TaxID=6596 RepID=UPI00234F258A|nr:serine-rich adhesin for platelets-like isoform X2 [Mercenaria mercenaria]
MTMHTWEMNKTSLLTSGRSTQMYNVPYGDGRNFQSWPSQQQQQQQQTGPPQQQQQQPLQQSISRQQQQPKGTDLTSKGLWVDVPNEEDTMHQMTVFKSSSKSHLTPPLDLSEGRRQVESPLDLSVKTRKRCADTTEYGEITRHSVLSEATMAKRLCVTRDYAYPQGHPNFNLETPFHGDSMARNKIIQKQLAMNKYPTALHKTSSQTSPSSLATQQQYADIQRQHLTQQTTRQLHLAQSQKLRTSQYGMAGAAVSQQMHSAIQKSHVPYESIATVKRSPQSMTESVALKGFFEPTQKVTVNANSTQQTGHISQQPAYPRLPAEQRIVGPTSRILTGKSSELGDFDDRSRQLPYPNTTMYQRQVPEVNRSFSGQTSTVNDIELMQQKTIQYQRQIQAQKSREQLAMLSQKMMTPQDQQKMAYFMHDMQKQAESRVSQTQAATQGLYGSRGQHSPYTQSRQPASATASYQDSLRKERGDYSSQARCIRVGQPVPLSDIHQEHSHALEQVHAVQNRPDLIAQQQIVAETNKYNARNKETSYPSQQAMLNVARMQHTIRYEPPPVRYGIPKETNESSANYMVRNEPNSAGLALHHPSVIQRPQGYIPPRVVRGSGRATESTAHRVSSESQQMQRFDYSSDQTNRIRQEIVAARDRSYSQKHDMLSGKEVMKIQQRVAEQRGDASFSGAAAHNKNYTKTVQHRDASEHAQSAFPGSSSKNSVRRRSFQEQQGRDPADYSRSVSSDGHERRHSFSKSPVSPNSGSNTQKHDVGGGSERQMISLKTCPSERSITKGTSGLTKGSSDMDPFSQFLMRELKKTDDDKLVNPFANRSLLEEFDRSANSSPVHKTDSAQLDLSVKKENIESSKKIGSKETSNIDTNVTKSEDSSYTVPLQIAIPGHKVSPPTSTATSSSSSSSLTSSSSSSSSFSTARSSVIASSKTENNSSKHPKLMSRKQMILNAFRQEEEDLKNTTNTVNIDQNEKVPMESAKYAARKSDKESNQHGYPSSPKMPILSPQERNRNTPLVSPAVGEPPHLEDSSRTGQGSDSSKKEINSLEEHLHRLISDAVKGSVNKDKESVYETVRRELSSQPQGKVFLSRQLSQTKNIPVANVAPIVHGKAVADALEGRDKNVAGKIDSDFDEEDDKMADIVTRSLFGDQVLFDKEFKRSETDNNDSVQVKQELDTEGEKSDSNLSLPSFNADSLFDENSNSKRMSPGLKKLMLYRHRDNSNSGNEKSNGKSSMMNKKSKSWPAMVKNEPVLERDRQIKSLKSKGRNVFGAFSEIVAQQSSSEMGPENPGDSAKGLRRSTETALQWTQYHQDEAESRDIIMVSNTDYDGDDEQARENQLQRKNKHSNTKQQADRLIKKARHRRNSKQEGDLRSRHAFHVKRKSYKGFVDFMPQVLPRRTRSKSSASTTHRRKAKTGSPARRHSRRSSSHEAKTGGSPQKTRQRRASSLDRETKSRLSKLKTKQTCFSDNEIESDKTLKRGSNLHGNAVDSDATWHNEDESTDEDYFQNYEDEFKQFIRKSDSNLRFKKAPSTKKKKGFHFKQKYIFQRKRRVNKGRGRGFDPSTRFGARLDAIYSFHEEGQELDQFQDTPGVLYPHCNIPAPADLKRVTVGKDSGQTVLHRAARMGLEEVVLYSLATGSVDVNARDNAGYTALHECALRGRVQIGKHLLTYGADVNCCSTDGIRPIHDAVENDNLEMLRLLLSYGADPTLATYAGRSLIKIARSERMLKYIKRYNCDINGYATDEEEKPWQFKRSSTVLESESGSGCAIFDNLPSDPEDESQDLCTFSSKPLFVTKRLTLQPNKRVEDFLLLDDILDSYKITGLEFMSHGTSSGVRHLIKQLPQNTLLDAHQDSIYFENFKSKDENASVEVIRKVDSTQLIAKLEKNSASSSKRAKV